MTEPDLIPFVNAQAQVYGRVVEELTDGVSGLTGYGSSFRSLRAWDTARRRSATLFAI